MKVRAKERSESAGMTSWWSKFNLRLIRTHFSISSSTDTGSRQVEHKEYVAIEHWQYSKVHQADHFKAYYNYCPNGVPSKHTLTKVNLKSL